MMQFRWIRVHTHAVFWLFSAIVCSFGCTIVSASNATNSSYTQAVKDPLAPVDQVGGETGKEMTAVFSLTELKTLDEATKYFSSDRMVYCLGTTDTHRYFTSPFNEDVKSVKRTLMNDALFQKLAAEKKRRLQNEPPIQIPYLRPSKEYLKWINSVRLTPYEGE